MMELESEGLVWCVISSCCVCVCDAAVFFFVLAPVNGNFWD